MDDKIQPQPGPQEAFLKSSADIAVYGGGAGAGKSFALLLEPLRHRRVKRFGAVIFRREATQITSEGGLWDEAMSLYPRVGCAPIRSPHLGFRLSKTAKITFRHLNREDDVLSWQGAQVALIGYDELTHFTRRQFIYMLSRNRSSCGVRPYIRGTCNPDADSWLAEFLAWWIEQDPQSERYGLPIPERAGAVRYLVMIGDTVMWGDSPDELAARFGVERSDAKSVTFIPASIRDNPILMRLDPGYLANLRALSFVERSRLLDGNWKIRPAAGLYFPRRAANVIDAAPADIVSRVRAWDLAATKPTESNPSPDATAGVLVGRRANGRFVVLHVEHMREMAHSVRGAVESMAHQDGRGVRVLLPQDPGQAGKDQASTFAVMLAGQQVQFRRPTGDKITRAEPAAAQWQAGNVDVVLGPWTTAFLDELESFPPSGGGHDDQVDAFADAINWLSRSGAGYAGSRQ